MKKLIPAFAFCLISGSLFGQPPFVEVKDEPGHHLVFENNFLRILDVHLKPGDTTLYHRHKTPSVFIYLSQNKVRSQLLNKEMGNEVVNSAGAISYDQIATERIHQVWNTDTIWMHVMDVELKPNDLKSKRQSLQLKELNPLFKESLLNGFKMSLSLNQNIQLPSTAGGYLLVSLGNSEIIIEANGNKEHRFMKAGHYEWISSNDKSKVENKSNSNAEFALLQF